jgi:hypothetical protein
VSDVLVGGSKRSPVGAIAAAEPVPGPVRGCPAGARAVESSQKLKQDDWYYDQSSIPSR